MVELAFLNKEGSHVSTIILLTLATIVAVVIIQNLRSYFRLSGFKGPWVASWTNLSRMSWVYSGRAHEIHHDMHVKHGEFVRFAPNMISISNPEAIPTVYPIRTGFPKSEFYRVLMPFTKTGAMPAVFNTRDEALHKQIKTPITPLFSTTSVLQYERFVDRVIDVVYEQLDNRFASSGKAFDFGAWMQYYAFDVMGTLTFSKRYGFLENGADHNGLLDTIWTYMSSAAPFTQIPWLDEWWNKNPWLNALRKPGGLRILGIVAECCEERVKVNKLAEEGEKDKPEEVNEGDMLSRFLELRDNNPTIPPWAATAWSFSNVLAGSDSTGSTLKTVFYHLLSNRDTLEKLRAELKAANLTQPTPTFAEVRDLPYLNACINEATRMSPPFNLPFERVVPEGGIEILGRHFPAGTVVGMSPYVVGQHKPTFGEDVDKWNPDRFMVDDDLRKTRENAILTFGAGRRVCLGKHVAMLEMTKIIPSLVLNYEIEIVDPKRFTVTNGWFCRQTGLDATIRRL